MSENNAQNSLKIAPLLEGYDNIIAELAEYVASDRIYSEEAMHTANLCLTDALGCAVAALQLPACRNVVAPLFSEKTENAIWRSTIPATSWLMDPIQGAFTLGSMIRWLDYNDTWLAAEWGHPSDNIGALLAIAEALCRLHRAQNTAPLTVGQLLSAIIQAYEVQGVLALTNSFNRVGFDHVILVKIASAAIATKLLGGNVKQIADAISQAFVDAGPLRTYRHAPNVGARKSWAAGDATSRGLWLALLTMRGEKGYKTAVTAPTWGLSAVLFSGKPLSLERPLGCYVMENILFKVRFPAEFHAQTAVEAACLLHPLVRGKEHLITKIEIDTHEAALRIIDKKGVLRNAADRDHCLQYMVAVALLKGDLTAMDYEGDEGQEESLITMLRDVMAIRENKAYSEDYLDPAKRSIANAIKIFFTDGSSTEKIAIEYPIGHRRRRKEAIPLIWKKFQENFTTTFPEERVSELIELMQDHQRVSDLPIDEFMTLFTCPENLLYPF